MNKNEILDKIKKTEEHLANMKKMLEECQYERFKPKTGEDYYCVDDENEARRVNFELMNAVDQTRYNTYNCFKTEEEAKVEAEKILVRRMLEDIARRLNKSIRLNWDDYDQPKHCISLYYDGIVTGIHFSHKSQGSIYCIDENFKDIAIQEIGEERLKKYLIGE